MDHAAKPCGLYRTSEKHAKHPIGAGLLVRFHNHSKQGPPILLLPNANRNNRWQFQDSGYLIEDEPFLNTLVALSPEGLYRVREHFHPDEERVVNQDSLVQLGYNRAGEAIVFFPQIQAEQNALTFPDRGMKISAAVRDLLVAVDTRGPYVPRKLH